MCGSVVDIQSPTVRLGEEKRKKIEITGKKISWPALFHRAAIINEDSAFKSRGFERPTDGDYGRH